LVAPCIFTATRSLGYLPNASLKLKLGYLQVSSTSYSTLESSLDGFKSAVHHQLNLVLLVGVDWENLPAMAAMIG
jgi:hypothetical protein